MAMNMELRPFLTWLDVERRFKEETGNYEYLPNGINSIRCYADGVEIEYWGDKKNVNAWVASVFGPHLNEDKKSVRLDIGGHSYSIDLIQVLDGSVTFSRPYPLWRDRAYINGSKADFPQAWEDGPSVVAFHSFKGGVGRTTSLMTYATAYLNANDDRDVRMLIIDADLEAPGISFWLPVENRPTVSFIQFMEALHFPPVDSDSSLNYFASELRKTSMNVGGKSREIFILPAALDLAEVMDMPVQPEHIAKNPSNPWLLSDYIKSLGQRLKADIVFVDLRAGLSELSSPLLFDPRIEHFFVSTVAPQSIVGTTEVLNRLYKFQRTLSVEQRDPAKPSVILSLLTAQLKQLPVYTQAIEGLTNAYPSGDDDVLSPGIEILEAEFTESLMSIASVRQALELLLNSSLYKTASFWAIGKKNGDGYQQSNKNEPEVQQIVSSAQALHTTCERFQFAEKASTEDMLITDPLRNLAKHFVEELPNAVSIGAKGAGKTFTYFQICRTKTWNNFLNKVGQSDAGIREGLIYPLLVSSNVEDNYLKVVDSAREFCEEQLEFNAPKSSNTLTRINAGIRDNDTDWDSFWEKIVVEQFSSCAASDLEGLNDWLVSKGKSIVLVIDGIEDIFDEPEENENQKRAIKSLLQFPNKFSAIRNRQIGLVCFVRADYVQAVVRQNLAQYISRFQAFRLEWTPESFLRLAYWICGKAGVIGANTEDAERQTTEQLLSGLERLWGKKMGHNSSKEANSARWVFAALCDLNGRLQARDLVRFLKFSASQMIRGQNDSWTDRLLAPEAIRKSLPDCSREKVKEAVSEIKVLRQWQDNLITISSEYKKVPFSAEAVGLNNETLMALRELGIVYEDIDQLSEASRFYLPEIYRWGLNFQSAVGGRPRVQALLKRNLGGMPF